MAKTRLLIVNNEVVAYSDDKTLMTNFIRQYEIEDYRIEKIKHLPVDCEYGYHQKMLYEFEAFYCSENKPVVINDYILINIEERMLIMRDLLSDVDKWFDRFIKYIKLEDKELEVIDRLRRHNEGIVENITPPYEDAILGIEYGDFTVLQHLMKVYLS